MSHWLIGPPTSYSTKKSKPSASGSMSSTTQHRDQKQLQFTSDSRASISSYDTSSIMSEKERASASWQEVKPKKESRLSKFITAVKNIEPPEPVLPPTNRTASRAGWPR